MIEPVKRCRMTRNAKRDAARDELIRLLNGLEFYRAWRIAGIKASQGEARQEDLNAIVEPSTAFIKHFDDAGGGSMATFLKRFANGIRIPIPIFPFWRALAMRPLHPRCVGS